MIVNSFCIQITFRNHNQIKTVYFLPENQGFNRLIEVILYKLL